VWGACGVCGVWCVCVVCGVCVVCVCGVCVCVCVCDVCARCVHGLENSGKVSVVHVVLEEREANYAVEKVV
jgi:hypothetical protein